MGTKVAAFDALESGSSQGLASVLAGKNKLFIGEATVAVPHGSEHIVHNYQVFSMIPYLPYLM